MKFHFVIFITFDGNLLLVPWSYCTDLGGFIFMASYHLMEVFGWGSLTSPWLDDCACCLVVFPHVLALLITPWLHVSWMWSILSHYYGLIYKLILDMDDGSSPPKGLNDDGDGR
jgi:hypothetical protein